ncbi:MAG: ABC-F family ATP-binding cassette domain-containing protein, partial [Bacteroidota bacterium]
MNYLTLENVAKSYGEKTLFEGLNLQVNQGERIALVAKNGAGKTTLLKVIAGVEAAEGETHRIILRKGIRIGWLPQEPEFKAGQSVLEAVFDSDNAQVKAVKAYEEALLLNREADLSAAMLRMEELKAWDIEARLKEILFKFNIKDLTRPVDVLSGGQKKRLALAKLLIEEPEFLILDEPTNHLDIQMIEWLESYLQNPNLTLFMVTHDRYFLNRVCNIIVEIDGGSIHRYVTNYEGFLVKRSARLENQAANLERTQKLFKRELEWMRRQPQARTTKAKSRVDDFYNIKEKAHQKVEETEIKIDMKGARLGSKIVELHYVSKSFGKLQIVKDFDYKFRKNERVGIVGPNGVGKTTFLQLLTKEMRPDSGKVVVGGTVKFGYYTQSGISLSEDKRVIDVITDIAEYIPLEKGAKLTAASLLERFLFSRKQQQHYVRTLSGGERRRLHLLTVLMENPNFLILDEPTNDLDLITLNVLEEFLLEFPGCVLIVTHDRYFM